MSRGSCLWPRRVLFFMVLGRLSGAWRVVRRPTLLCQIQGVLAFTQTLHLGPLMLSTGRALEPRALPLSSLAASWYGLSKLQVISLKKLGCVLGGGEDEALRGLLAGACCTPARPGVRMIMTAATARPSSVVSRRWKGIGCQTSAWRLGSLLIDLGAFSRRTRAWMPGS